MVHKYIKSAHLKTCPILCHVLVQILLVVSAIQIEKSQAKALCDLSDSSANCNDTFILNKNPDRNVNLTELEKSDSPFEYRDENTTSTRDNNTSSIDDDSSTIITDFIFRLKTNKSINKILNIFNLARMDNLNRSKNNDRLINSKKMIVVNEPQMVMLKQGKVSSNEQNSTNTNDTITIHSSTASLNTASTKTSTKNTTRTTSTRRTSTAAHETTGILSTSTNTSVTRTTKQILTSTVSNDNPQFLACIKACGTDHDCVREKCLIDSTYFG